MTARKIVLVAHTKYERRHEATLKSLVKRRVELFCAVGEDCRRWEEAMDALCAGVDVQGEWTITTSSHPRESMSDVLAFAERWELTEDSEVEVVEVGGVQWHRGRVVDTIGNDALTLEWTSTEGAEDEPMVSAVATRLVPPPARAPGSLLDVGFSDPWTPIAVRSTPSPDSSSD